MRAKTSLVVLAIPLAAVLMPAVAQAHWCDDLWGSAYNLTVRPESDTVTVPSGGSASLVVYVQNNMGYLLPSFKLTATATGYTATPTAGPTKVTGTLLPGERQKVTFAISGTAGQLAVTSLTFHITFGSGTQPNRYAGNSGASSPNGKAAVVQLSNSLAPTGFPGLANMSATAAQKQFNDQAPQLAYMAQADFGDLNKGLDDLMTLYCAGSGSWDHNGAASLSTYCSGTATTCPATVIDVTGETKYDYPHLWAAGHLAARKSALGTRLGTLRERLKCGTKDNGVFSAFATVMLGYLGDDATTRTYLKGVADDTAAANQTKATIAKAALYLAGNSADVTAYQAAVTAGLTSSDQYVAGACATAIAIHDQVDAPVGSVLLKNIKWNIPDSGEGGDQGKGLYASHLLSLVAWDRRGWAAQAGETGIVSFYGETGGTTSSSSGTTTSSSSGTTTSSSSGTTTSSSSGTTTSSSSSGTSGGGGGGGGGCEIASGSQVLSAMAIFALMALFIARRRK